MADIERLVKILISKNETISTMESCTGGLFASSITDIPGASGIFKVGLVTYSNEFKVHFGVDSKVIEEYSVYSKETAVEMSKNASLVAGSNWGVGITGLIGRPDPANPVGEEDTCDYAIYNKQKGKVFCFSISYKGLSSRNQKKQKIVDDIVKNFICILEEENLN